MAKALCLIYLIWGMNWVVMKTANTFFPPITFVAYRFLFGALVLLSVWFWLHLPLPKKKYWPWIFLTGILQMGLNNIAAQTSMLTLGAGMVSVLNYSMPIFAAVMAHFLLGERLTWRKGAGIVLAIAGMAVLMDVHAGGDVTAICIGLLSAVFWGLASIFVKLKLSDVNPISLTTWQMVCASLSLLAYTAIVPQGEVIWNTESVLCLIYNGVLASALAFFLWSWILQHIEVSKASVAVLAVPVVGVVGGILCLGEPMTLHIFFGMIMIMAGIYIVVTHKRQPA
ncbi:DMT family transporter [Mitsuokella multacida]|uniref:DMT family transporter n=1 Tax=Mitsuokella multacida TaxID=52226 RepID=UPI00265EFB2F|nr:DMT family transporter [Mitsuokella multacida]MDO5582746.1 DMT family transporter [Mitsuokella multacida]